jgi:hypothetical protein
MSQYPVSVRFDKTTRELLRAEAKRVNVPMNQFIQSLVARGFLYNEFEAALQRVRTVSTTDLVLRGNSQEGFRELLTSVLETRILLQTIAAKSMPDAPTAAKAEAKALVDRLLGEEQLA